MWVTNHLRSQSTSAPTTGIFLLQAYIYMAIDIMEELVKVTYVQFDTDLHVLGTAKKSQVHLPKFTYRA